MQENAYRGSRIFLVVGCLNEAKDSEASIELGSIRDFRCLVCLLRWDLFLNDMLVAEVSTRNRKSKLE